MKKYQLNEEEREKVTWLFQQVPWNFKITAICLISKILMEAFAISNSNRDVTFISYQTSG